MDEEEFKRKQEARVLAHWQDTKGTPAARPKPRPMPPVDDMELERLQKQAKARAAAFWDQTEAADLSDDGCPLPLAYGFIDAVEASAEAFVHPEAKRYHPEGYPAYLQTAHWRALREHMLKRAGGYCMQCHQKHAWLEVHHLTYRNLGHERESDLLVLCRECHQQEHADA